MTPVKSQCNLAFVGSDDAIKPISPLSLLFLALKVNHEELLPVLHVSMVVVYLKTVTPLLLLVVRAVTFFASIISISLYFLIPVALPCFIIRSFVLHVLFCAICVDYFAVWFSDSGGRGTDFIGVLIAVWTLRIVFVLELLAIFDGADPLYLTERAYKLHLMACLAVLVVKLMELEIKHKEAKIATVTEEKGLGSITFH